MSRDAPWITGGILNNVFGLPGIIVFGLVAGISVGIFAGHMNTSKTLPQQTAMSGSRMTLPILVPQGSFGMTARSMLAAGQPRPVLATPVLDPALAIQQDVALLGCVLLYLDGPAEVAPFTRPCADLRRLTR